MKVIKISINYNIKIEKINFCYTFNFFLKIIFFVAFLVTNQLQLLYNQYLVIWTNFFCKLVLKILKIVHLSVMKIALDILKYLSINRKKTTMHQILIQFQIYNIMFSNSMLLNYCNQSSIKIPRKKSYFHFAHSPMKNKENKLHLYIK